MFGTTWPSCHLPFIQLPLPASEPTRLPCTHGPCPALSHIWQAEQGPASSPRGGNRGPERGGNCSRSHRVSWSGFFTARNNEPSFQPQRCFRGPWDILLHVPVTSVLVLFNLTNFDRGPTMS